MKKSVVMFSLLAMMGLLLCGCSTSHSASAAAPVDLRNTVCPVTMDTVGSSTLTETYDGKIYHFCCDDCPKQFRTDPAKYANAVAQNPAKYGVKAGM